MKQLLILGILLLAKTGFAQEISCQVRINAQQTGKTNLTVFNTLEESLTDFVNETNWTSKEFKEYEKINCSMFITVTDYNSGSFSGTIQVQSSRPVYGSSMTTPVFNFKDDQFSFEYVEYAPLSYNASSFESNLVSVISFYVYTILGLDADTFAPMGGDAYFQEAQHIVSLAKQGGYAGWEPTSGDQSRYAFITDILSPAFGDFRKALYTYHREGLDVMHENVAVGKRKIADALQQLGEINGMRSNSVVMRSFFDAKATEIEKIFSGGPSVNIAEVIGMLNDLAPQYSENWRNISY